MKPLLKRKNKEILEKLSSFSVDDIPTYDTVSCTQDVLDIESKIALVIGNEGNGLKAETVKAAGNVCYIPMSGQVESLNASVACSIMMYEAKRQRK